MDEAHEELFSAFMAASGETAFRKLWQLANDPEASAQQRERLLVWFAEMALGKPRTMDAAPAAASSGTGVIILPAVEEESGE